MESNRDNILQIIFVGALIMVALLFYFTRIAGSQAGDRLPRQTGSRYEYFTSAYQYQQEEKKVQTRIEILKAEYARDLLVFKDESLKIDNLNTLSDLEKREKREILKGIYPDEYFDRKLELIEEQLLELESLRKAKCLKFCVYQDLPGQGS